MFIDNEPKKRNTAKGRWIRPSLTDGQPWIDSVSRAIFSETHLRENVKKRSYPLFFRLLVPYARSIQICPLYSCWSKPLVSSRGSFSFIRFAIFSLLRGYNDATKFHRITEITLLRNTKTKREISAQTRDGCCIEYLSNIFPPLNLSKRPILLKYMFYFHRYTVSAYLRTKLSSETRQAFSSNVLDRNN